MSINLTNSIFKIIIIFSMKSLSLFTRIHCQARFPNGQEFAVKRLFGNSEQSEVEFKNEILLVAKLQHKCLVSLQGFCSEGRERILIYELVGNGSLDKFIFGTTLIYCACINIIY